MDKKEIGFSGEKYAANLLIRYGYKLLERNFRTNFGEIDLIALKDDTLIFIEVKTRKSRKFGKPEEAVTPYKLKKIERVGELYSKMHTNLPVKLRIDVVSLEILGKKVISEKIITAT